MMLHKDALSKEKQAEFHPSNSALKHMNHIDSINKFGSINNLQMKIQTDSAFTIRNISQDGKGF